MAYDMYEPKERDDGRWIVVYGKDMPRAGEQKPGTDDYATAEAAMEAGGPNQARRGMFDHYLQEREPEPVDGDKPNLGTDNPKMGTDDEEIQGTVTMPLCDFLKMMGMLTPKKKAAKSEDE